MICDGQSVQEIVNAYDAMGPLNVWVRRIQYLKPKNVLELGTGQGSTGAWIMGVLDPAATFTTINYDNPPGYPFGEQLEPWKRDHRLKRIIADTTEASTRDQVTDGVDLMFMDTMHEAHVASRELFLFQSKLADGAIVIVDDLFHNDMGKFWDSLPYEKVHGEQGVFRYNAARQYEAVITR